MRRRIVACCAVLVFGSSVFAVVPSVRGALLSKDDIFFGSGAITLDTDTGLEWLDVSLSTNRSYADVSAQFGQEGDYFGFRHATEPEISVLFDSLGMNAVPGLQSLVGITWEDLNATFGYYIDEDSSDPKTGGAILGVNGSFVNPNSFSVNDSGPGFGNWLVRPGMEVSLGQPAVTSSAYFDVNRVEPDTPFVVEQTVGWTFFVRSPVQLSALGWYDMDRDGLATAHAIGIWAHDEARGHPPIVVATVSPGTESPLVEHWRTVDTPDTILPVGGYVIGGYVPDTQDVAMFAGNNLDAVVSDSRVSIGAPALPSFDGTRGMFARPDTHLLLSGAFFGPTLFVNAVGDLNGDLLIDAGDATVLFDDWGAILLGRSLADLNGDNVVDAADAGIMFANWKGDGTQSVPEPAVSLTVLAVLFLVMRRPRK